MMARACSLICAFMQVVPFASCVRKSSHQAELKKQSLEKPNSDLAFLFDEKEKLENSNANILKIDDSRALGHAKRGVNIDHIRFDAYKPLTHEKSLELNDDFPVYQYTSQASWLLSIIDALYYQGHVANFFQDNRHQKLKNMLQNNNHVQARRRPIDARELGKQIAWTTSAQRSGSFRIYDNENRGNWQQVLESIFASRLGMEVAKFQKEIPLSAASAGMDSATNRAAEIQSMLNQIDTGIKVVGEHLHMNTETSDADYLSFFCVGQVIGEECEEKRPEKGTTTVYIVDRPSKPYGVLSRAVKSITPSSNRYLWKLQTYKLPNGQKGDSFEVTLEDSSKGKCVSAQYKCNVVMKFTISGLPTQ
jgi:hypothetical protein